MRRDQCQAFEMGEFANLLQEVNGQSVTQLGPVKNDVGTATLPIPECLELDVARIDHLDQENYAAHVGLIAAPACNRILEGEDEWFTRGIRLVGIVPEADL